MVCPILIKLYEIKSQPSYELIIFIAPLQQSHTELTTLVKYIRNLSQKIEVIFQQEITSIHLKKLSLNYKTTPSYSVPI